MAIVADQLTKANRNTGQAHVASWMSKGVNATAFAPAGYSTV